MSTVITLAGRRQLGRKGTKVFQCHQETEEGAVPNGELVERARLRQEYEAAMDRCFPREPLGWDTSHVREVPAIWLRAIVQCVVEALAYSANSAKPLGETELEQMRQIRNRLDQELLLRRSLVEVLPIRLSGQESLSVGPTVRGTAIGIVQVQAGAYWYEFTPQGNRVKITLCDFDDPLKEVSSTSLESGEYTERGRPITVGRSKEHATLVVDDPSGTLSRAHFRINFGEERNDGSFAFSVIQLSSSNHIQVAYDYLEQQSGIQSAVA